MNIEEDTLRKVLKECKLVQKNSKATGTRFLSPALNAWDSFIMEYGLDMEWKAALFFMHWVMEQ
jgi:hypothetical protein